MSAYDEGSDAYFDGIPLNMNPYDNADEYDRSEWAYGWIIEFEIENDVLEDDGWEDDDY
jgi:hypothetical protein